MMSEPAHPRSRFTLKCLLHQQHFVGLSKITGFNPVKINTAGYSLSMAVQAIPNNFVIAGIQIAVYQRSHNLAHAIVYHQAYLALLRQLVANAGGRVERIRIILH